MIFCSCSVINSYSNIHLCSCTGFILLFRFLNEKILPIFGCIEEWNSIPPLHHTFVHGMNKKRGLQCKCSVKTNSPSWVHFKRPYQIWLIKCKTSLYKWKSIKDPRLLQKLGKWSLLLMWKVYWNGGVFSTLASISS